MNKQRQRAVTLMLLMIMLFTSPVGVFAEENGREVEITLHSGDGAHVEKAVEAASEAVDGQGGGRVEIAVGKKDRTLMSASGDKLLIYPDSFKGPSKRDVTKAMTAFVNEIRDSPIPADRQQAIMTEVQEAGPGVSAVMLPIVFEGTKGNIFTAYKILGPMLDILSVILGIAAVILIALVLGSTAADLAYIGLPMWREQQAESGRGGGGGKKPFMVSHEALSTVQEVEKSLGENYQSAYVLYFKRRAITYIVLAFCIMYLIGGQLSGVISFLLNLASGISG